MTNTAFRSGSSEYKGVRVDRVLRVSTAHRPNLTDDLTSWNFGNDPEWGIEWFYAYEEAPTESFPEWLIDLCIVARDEYGCNWVCLDPDGDVVPGLPVYDH